MKQKLNAKQQQLVADNHGLIYGFADAHKLDLEEYYGVLALALCNAAQCFDENKGKFSTVAYRCMSNAVKNYLKVKARSVISMISLDADYIDGDSDNESLANVIMSDEIQPDLQVEGEECKKILLSVLSEKEQQIAIDRMNGLSEEQIANKVGCTQQNINAWIKKIRIKWHKFLLPVS